MNRILWAVSENKIENKRYFSFVARWLTPSKSDKGTATDADIRALNQNAPQVDAQGNTQLNNLGRAALISTSPLGVQGTDPTQRYRLLGNSVGLGNS